jgi:hypothetical protein
VNNLPTTPRSSATSCTHKKPLSRRNCRRCHKFGTFSPDSLVCDRCLGTLPLIFVHVTVNVGGAQ